MTEKRNVKIALAVITTVAFLLRLWAAHLDPFLNYWDERFHALVARNLSDDLLLPQLRGHATIPFDFRLWQSNGVWLHKQPLFLWQIAASIKVFGATTFAVRFPSVVMGTLCVPMAYRLGYWFSGKPVVGLTTALFQCCSYFVLTLTVGEEGMDHNDVAMGFYTMASFWAYSHYETSHRADSRIKWAIATGMLAGAAILNKWLPGLLVFEGWGINLILSGTHKRQLSKQSIGHFLLGVAVCAIVVLPWQIYILCVFPKEALYEYAYNNKHLTEIVEGHIAGPDLFWNNFPDYFSEHLWFLVPLGFLYYFIRNLRRWCSSQGPLLTCFLSTFLFYSFVVKTKIDSHFMFVAVFGLVFAASLSYHVSALHRIGKVIFPIVALLFAFFGLQHVNLLKHHDPTKPAWKVHACNTKIYRRLKTKLLPDTKVVLNAPQLDEILVMFYNPGIDAYSWAPSELQLKPLFDRNVRIAVFPSRRGYDVPAYVLKYKNAYLLDVSLCELAVEDE